MRTDPTEEVVSAEKQADESRRRLEETLDRLGTLVQGTKVELEHKVEDAATSVEEKAGKIRGKLDDGVVQIDLFVESGRQKLDETLANLDHLVTGTFVDVNHTLRQAQDIVGRVKLKVKDVLIEADHILYRFEDVITGFRGDLVGSSENVLGRAEKVTQNFRAHFSTGAEEINQLIDRAEKTLLEISDPIELVKKYPRVGVSALLFGGILIGVFFRKIFQETAVGSKSVRDDLNEGFTVEPEILNVDAEGDENHEAA